jgi:predicted permease
MACAGFIAVRCRWIDEKGLRTLGQVIALLTLPCLIFYRFATRFDPREFPDWWKYALIGAAISLVGLALGKLVAFRHHNNDEATMLVGFQNAGFFVLPMLQALLPPQEYAQASLMLFVMVMPFNAMLWFVGSRLLLRRRSFEWKTIFTPPLIATIVSVLLFGLLHDWIHQWDGTLLAQVLFGDAKPEGAIGAVQQIGDLTVPLATITLGGTIAASLRGPLVDLQFKRAALETMAVKMVLYPLLGYCGMRAVMIPSPSGGSFIVWLLLMLQFSAPPAINLGVFAQQYGYRMQLIPVACLLCYIIALATVPFFVALVPR